MSLLLIVPFMSVVLPWPSVAVPIHGFRTVVLRASKCPPCHAFGHVDCVPIAVEDFEHPGVARGLLRQSGS